MGALDKWAERVYAEADVGRSIATSLSGVVGLAVYLFVRDWAIALFALLIFFPLARLTASAIHARRTRGATRRQKRSDAEQLFRSLSPDEKAVVSAFASAGGCVLTWSHINSTDLSRAAIEPLIRRDVLSTSMTADGMRETFVLDPDLFDVGVRQVVAQA